LLTVACCILANPTALRAEEHSDEGLSVQVAEQTITLDAPTLNGRRGGDQQVERIESILGGLRFRQFARKSIVAPVRIDLDYIRDSQEQRVGHQVHVAFIVHTRFETFTSDRFSQSLLNADSTAEAADSDADRKADQYSRPVSKDELRRAGIEPVDDDTEYRRVNLELLDEIRLTGVLRFSRSRSGHQQRIDVALDDRFQNRWQSLEDADKSGDYRGFASWITATKLAEIETLPGEAVLIEARFAMHEPADWFAGSNFLRSKLPLVLQESARRLRRELK
jgi:hypothetical protein